MLVVASAVVPAVAAGGTAPGVGDRAGSGTAADAGTAAPTTGADPATDWGRPVDLPQRAATAGPSTTANTASATSTTPNTASAAAAGPPLNVTLHVSLTPNRPGEVRVRAVYHNPAAATAHGAQVLQLRKVCSCPDASGARETRIRDQRTRILSESGFNEVTAGGSRWNLTWDGTTAEPSVTYRIDVNETGSIGTYDDLVRAVDVGPWAWPGGWRNLHVEPNVRRVYENVSYTLRAASPGIAGSGNLCLGCAVRHRRIHGQRVHFVYTPWADAPPAATDDLAELLGNVSYDLRVGGRDRDVYLFFVGGPGTSTGYVERPNDYDGWYGGPGADDAGVHMPVDGWNRSLSSRVTPRQRMQIALVHEYVHTRQTFVSEDGSEMCSGPTRGCSSWLFESHAMYYASVFAYYEDLYPNPTYTISGPRPFSADERNHPLDHDDQPLHSNRGARTLLALDWRIRNATGGDRSLHDAFRRLNAMPKPVTHTDFVTAASAAAGRSVSPFVSQYVTSTTTPGTGAIPDFATFERRSWVRDGDGRWNTSLSLSATADAFLAPRHLPVRNGTVTFTLRNTGTDPAIGHAVNVGTPGGWRVASASPSTGRWNASAGTWHVTDLDAGEHANLTVTFAPPQGVLPGGPNVSVRATDSDGNAANVTLPVVPFADGRRVVYVGSTVLPGGGPEGPPGVIPLETILVPERIEGLTCTEPALCTALRALGLTRNERLVAEVSTEEGTRYYFARVEEGEVTEFRAIEAPGAVDRTATVRTDAATVREVYAAEDRTAALRRAVEEGRITVDRGGFLGGVADLVARVVSALGDLLGGLFG